MTHAAPQPETLAAALLAAGLELPAEQVANATVDLLCQRIRGEGEAHAQVDVGCELIARESTALNR